MKNQWINFFSGIIKVNVKGKGIERLLNKFIRENIMIWDIKRHGEEAVTFFILLKDIPKIRPLIRKSGCKMTFLNKKGFPFLIKKSISNSGFVLGFLSFLFIIFLLSNVVWGIEIEGAKPETEHKIMKELKKMGITKGKLQFFIKDVDEIQKDLTNNIKEITWIGVVLNGTTYQFDVVEKNQPEPVEKLSPRNLVAKREGVITYMFVEEGQPLVKINEFVRKGQILISGTIGSDKHNKLVPARGKILGNTWYLSKVEVPLQSTFHVLTGSAQKKYFLNIGKISIPVFGFEKTKYKQYEIEKVTKKLKFLKWSLPISFQVHTIREKESVLRAYTLSEAVKIGKEIGRRELQNKLSDEAIIKGENVLHQANENGKVKLSIHYQVIENITLARPITQGD